MERLSCIRSALYSSVMRVIDSYKQFYVWWRIRWDVVESLWSVRTLGGNAQGTFCAGNGLFVICPEIAGDIKIEKKGMWHVDLTMSR
jgi:hypothetical protein